MNILVAIVIVICFFIAVLFGSAAFVMISKDLNEKKVRKQNELLNELEVLREEYYTDIRKLDARITTISINQQILEESLKNFLNK
jgi:Na+-transporting NADH:ubiquinone oxidoreductase subunit NqrC